MTKLKKRFRCQDVMCAVRLAYKLRFGPASLVLSSANNRLDYNRYLRGAFMPGDILQFEPEQAKRKKPAAVQKRIASR